MIKLRVYHVAGQFKYVEKDRETDYEEFAYLVAAPNARSASIRIEVYLRQEYGDLTYFKSTFVKLHKSVIMPCRFPESIWEVQKES